MSETCIVCLGDLGKSGTHLDRASSPAAKLEDADQTESKSPIPDADLDDERIAHLLPCGHDLHNGCLKPWVERANSCPICRQCFNKVELSHLVRGKLSVTRLLYAGCLTTLLRAGPVISSYDVGDRTQVADIDPSMYIDELDDDPEFPPCPVCEDDDNEELLLSCDGCGVDYHTYCVELDDIPRGHWFCESCAAQRAAEGVNVRQNTRRSHRPSDRRTRAQQRRERTRVQATHSGWARVWQSVWDRLNLDLDFPFDDEPSISQEQRAARELSEHRDVRQWERRLRIAERQGGTNRFRETAAALLDVNEIRQLRAARERPVSLEPESQEELRAWNALEKAKEIQMDPASTRKKRKSPTASPCEAGPSTEPERPLKRPRTRRNPEVIDQPSDSPAEISGSNRRPTIPSSTRSEGPSFLQSLLKEVESSTAADDSMGQNRPSMLPLAGHSSPLHSSPGASPPASNHASPRALSATPPPSLSPRSHSPLSLTSKVEPIFPPPEFSPTRSPPPPPSDNHRIPEWRRHQNNELHHPRPTRNALGSSPPRPEENSSPRVNMSLEAKEGVQKMVSSALRPHWHRSEISKDEFTDINRNVSRMLYEKVGDEENLKDGSTETWEKMANEEVAKAVQSLKAGS
ncbi:MAG: hypothetical protein LQ338_000291 [Usnochroma carphineum]|nr:MAG: hypothetical protein LQ338_000291 [Usnochroma carphineum]